MTLVLSIAGLTVMMSASMASAGQEAGQAKTPVVVSPEMASTCIEAQRRSLYLLDAIDRRLERSRQANSPSEIRAALSDVQRALVEARVELDRCTALAATGLGEAHTGHTPTAAAAAESAAANGMTARSGISVVLRSRPDPIRSAIENEFEVLVTDRLGKPIDTAQVSLLFFMAAIPSMKMPEMRNVVKLEGIGSGRYTGKGQVLMTGEWTITVSVVQDGKEIAREAVKVIAR